MTQARAYNQTAEGFQVDYRSHLANVCCGLIQQTFDHSTDEFTLIQQAQCLQDKLKLLKVDQMFKERQAVNPVGQLKESLKKLGFNPSDRLQGHNREVKSVI